MKECALLTQKICVTEIEFEKLMRVYYTALIKTKDIIEKLLKNMENEIYYNIAENISYRIKNPDSIMDKMIKKEYDLTYQSLIEDINDIAGIRIVCKSERDVYIIARKIEKLKQIRILKRKDYIKNPKESGYSAYHMILDVPIYLKHNKIWIKVELQIRTIAMDFWANLEHEAKYKIKREKCI